MRQISFVLSTYLIFFCFPAFHPTAEAQVVGHPNEIVGTVEFTNSNPEILEIIDLGSGRGEGLFEVRFEAKSQGVTPELVHKRTVTLDSGTSTSFSIPVEAGPLGDGTVFEVKASALLDPTDSVYWADSYHFETQLSAPVERSPAPPVEMHFQECVGLLKITWQDSNGQPVVVNDGWVKASALLPDGNFESRGIDSKFVQAGAHEYLALRGDGSSHWIRLQYELGTDPYSDTLRFEENFYDVSVNCDQITPLVVTVPSGSSELGRITGRLDIIGEDERRWQDLSLIRAIHGPDNNGRRDTIEATPSEGAFELENLVPGDYGIMARLAFGEGRDYQYLETPRWHLWGGNGMVHVPAGETVDLGNTFAIQPGYVAGSLHLAAPPSDIEGGFCLGDLRFPTPLGTSSASYSLGNSTHISSQGIASKVPGSTFSAYHGLAQAQFQGEAVLDPRTPAYLGSYSLALGGLDSEPTLWTGPRLELQQNDPFTEEEQVWFLRIDNRLRSQVEVRAGETVEYPLHYCFGALNVGFRTDNGEVFHDATIQGTGSFVGTDFEGNSADYSVSIPWLKARNSNPGEAQAEDVASSCLPAGSYELRPWFSLGSQSGNQVQLPILQDVAIGCRQIKDLTMGLDVELDDVPACVAGSPLTLIGRADGTGTDPVTIDAISYSVNGGASEPICSGCGDNPEFSAEVALTGCDNRVRVSATDSAGRTSSTTVLARFDDQPAVWSGCEPIDVEIESGDSAQVEYAPQAQDGCSGPLDVSCDMASGSSFPLGETWVTCQAVDECQNVGSCSFPVTVESSSANGPPEITSTPGTRVVEGELYTYPIVAVDPDGEPLTYSLLDGPQGMTLGADQVLRWTPEVGRLGRAFVAIEVRDPLAQVDQQHWSIDVVASPIDRSHLGKDFWLAFSQNGPYTGQTGVSWDDARRQFWVSISSELGAAGLVEIPGLGFQQAFSVAAGQSVRVDLPNEVMHREDDTNVGPTGYRSRVRAAAVHVTADRAIGVVGVNQNFGTSDSFLVYPTPVLGTAYTVPAFNSQNEAQLTLVATEDDTEVLITTPLGQTIIPPPGQTPENPLSLTLQRGDVYSTWGSTLGGKAFWLSGSRVRSNKPLALFSGNKCAFVPDISVGYCDHLVEQVYGDRNAGARFFAYPLATRFGGDLYRFVAIEEGTEIRVGGVLIANLGAGEFYDRLIEQPSEIVANRPIHVTQLATGSQFDEDQRFGSTLADPFSILLSPTASYLSRYSFLTPAPDDEDFLSYYVNVVIETAVLNTLTLDGQPVSASGFEPIPGTSYSGAALLVEPGTHRLEAARPFGLTTYAFGEHNSYGTAAGMVLGHQDAVDRIVATPAEQTQPAGGEACVDYVLQSAAGHRVPFVRVDLRVTGARSLSAVQYSDDSGAGRYCYRGIETGSDNIALSTGVAFTSVAVTWTGADQPEAPAIVSTPSLLLKDSEFVYRASAVDPNGDAVTFQLTEAPAAATVEAATGVVRWTPSIPADRQPTVHRFTLVARDAGGLTDQQPFEVTVIYPPALVEPVDPEDTATTEYSATVKILGGDQLFNQLRLLESPSSLEIVQRSGLRSYLMASNGLEADPRQGPSEFNPFCRESTSGVSSLVGEHRWQSEALTNMVLPVAGLLRDTDGNGVVNAFDDLFFVGLGQGLKAVAASDGSVAFRTTGLSFRTSVIPALADLDQNGSVEILAEVYDSASAGYRLAAFDSDGGLLWTGSHPVLEAEYASSAQTMTSIEVADLDGDGALEIIAGPRVFDAGGQHLWSFPIEASVPGFFLHEAFPLVIDLDGDGSKEMLFRNEVRRADGSLWWSLDGAVGSSRPVAQFAGADLDGDGQLEVVAGVHDGTTDALWAFDRQGTALWGPVPVSDAAIPAIADFDRDGALEVFHPRNEMLVDAAGNVLRVNRPDGRAAVRVAIGDLNGDGLYEFLVQESRRLEIYDVLSGYQWLDLQVPTLPTLKSQYGGSLIVDSDRDGQAEVFLGGSGVTTLMQGTLGGWPAAPFDQPSFGMQSNEPGQFGIRIPASLSAGRSADLWIGDVRATETSAGTYEVAAEVRNRGTASVAQAISVRLYRLAPENPGHELLADVSLPGMSAAGQERVVFPGLSRAQVAGELYAVVESAVVECEPGNNRARTPVVELEVFDSPTRRDQYLFLLNASEFGADPVFETTAPTQVAAGSVYLYDAQASDANTGDGLRFEVSAAGGNFPFGLAVNALTGQVRWQTEPGDTGTYRYRLSAIDLANHREDQVVTLQVVASTNQPPAILSEPPVVTTAGEPYVYQLVAEDPEGQALVYEAATMPQGMTIDSSGRVDWTPTAEQTGEHPVSLVVRDVENAQSVQDYTVTVTATQNLPPVIESAPATQGKVSRQYRYTIQAHDPEGEPLTYSKINAPAGLFLNSSTGAITWTPSLTGAYPVTIGVSDGLFTEEHSWILVVAPRSQGLDVVLVASPEFVDAGAPITVQATVVGAAGEYSLEATQDGAPLALDASGAATVIAGASGSHRFTATVNDGYENDQDEALVGIKDPADDTPPEVEILSPSDGGFVTAPTTVRGRVLDDNLLGWQLRLVQKGIVDSQRVLAVGTHGGADIEVGTLDPTLLMNGVFALVLEAKDVSGNNTSYAVALIVEGNMKIGHYSLTLEDIAVDLVGIPLRVTRTYDTRQKDELLDFGYGWSIDYQNLRLQESRTVGRFWRVVEEGDVLPQLCVRPNGIPVVSVTLPNGRVEKFRARAEPECQSALIFTNLVDIVFDPIGDTRSRLEQASFGKLRATDGKLVDLGDPSTPVDIRHYVLTTRDGTRYEIDDTFGIERIIDSNGNTVTYSDAAVTHSTGQRLEFLRNSQGLVTSIVLPDGEILRYGYDSQLDLVSFSDQTGATAPYSYYPGHLLQDLRSLAGRRATRNEYDDAGRLIAVIDANNRRIVMDHDLGSQTERVTNRNGETTIYVYNERGNIVSETNALGETITRTYDDSDNQLSETNALGHSTSWTFDGYGNRLTEMNALGEVTTFTYDERDNSLSQTDDADIVVLRNSYNLSNNLLTMTDAEGNRIEFFNSSRGQVERVTDAEGNVIRYTYDENGFQLSQTDPDGRQTEWSYDAMGNVLSETRTRTAAGGQIQILITQQEYDDKNRLVRTVDALGHANTMEYNADGQVTRKTDSLGRSMVYDYDSQGRLTTTTYPDGSTDRIAYDNEGREIRRTNRDGRVTRMIYDAAGRIIETIFPDSTRTRTEYDAAGRIKAIVDERGNRTEYEHDDVGRRVLVRDALGLETAMSYNNRGLRTSTTDALGRSVRFVYNEGSRLIETIYPDNTPANLGDNPRIRMSYDGLNRKVTETDELGVTTRFEYDSRNNLTAVVDALGQRTEYGYDDQSNKIHQTDASGRTTRWQYDELGRMIGRTLPMGQRESMTYDEVGNLIARTDFNGQLTTYIYDVNNRRVRSLFHDLSEEARDYSPSGLLRTLEDRRGITRYVYDNRDRLIRIISPDSREVAYAYDASGNKISLTTANQNITYAYDALNRLGAVSDANGQTAYQYDPVGNRSLETKANGAGTLYQYDERNRVTRIEHRDAGQAVLLGMSYQWNADNTRSRILEDGGRVTDYTYDALKRLTAEQVVDATVGNRTTRWEYDATGNRLSQDENGSLTSYLYNANDQLISEGTDFETTTYQYDANGSTVGKLVNGVVLATYLYDPRNRMVGSVVGGHSTSYEYDENGIRRNKIENGNETRYLVDPTQAYTQVIEETDGEGRLKVTYTYGDDLISQQRFGASGLGTSYYQYDGLGSTRLLTDGTGQEQNTYVYTAFGTLEHKTGDTENTYLYTGERFDSNLDLYYLRSRYFDPGAGRFHSLDTWQGNSSNPTTLHKYLYANADPANHIDPSGLFSTSEVNAGAAHVARSATKNLVGKITNRNTLKPVLKRQLQKIFTARNLKKGVVVGTTVAVIWGLAKRIHQQEKDDSVGIPILSHGDELPLHSNHILDAHLGFGLNHQPTTMLLSRVPRPEGTWYNKYQPCRPRDRAPYPPRSVVCDEYPFLSTAQGGEANFKDRLVSLRLLPAHEGSLQGTLIKKFYRVVNPAQDGESPDSQFIALALPGLPSFFTDKDGNYYRGFGGK